MKKILVSALLFLSVTVWAQDQAPFNTLQVSLLAPLDITYQNAQELLMPKIVANAIRVDIKVKQERTNVYAQLSFDGRQGNHPLNGALSLRLGAKTAADALLPGPVVALSSNPSLLFGQPPGTGNTQHHSFFYDLLINPQENMVPPGDHPFALTFTITAE